AGTSGWRIGATPCFPRICLLSCVSGGGRSAAGCDAPRRLAVPGPARDEAGRHLLCLRLRRWNSLSAALVPDGSASRKCQTFGGILGDRIGRYRIIWISVLGPLPLTLILPYADLFWT